VIESLLHNEETDDQYFRGKVDLARSLFDKQRDFNSAYLLEVNKIQHLSAKFSFGSSLNALTRWAQISTEICIKKFTILLDVDFTLRLLTSK